MKNKAKSLVAIVILLTTLLIGTQLNIVLSQETITGTPDDTPGVWLYSAGTTVPGGAPTDDIIKRAIDYDILDYIGNSAEEVYEFGHGLSEPSAGQEDTTLSEVIQGLSAVDDFGYIDNKQDDASNFDTGKNGYFLGGFNPATGNVIVSDGIPATGTLGPSEAPTEEKAEKALDGYEILIFEDAELSGMIITLSNSLGLTITISITDLQVNPPTPYGADDTLIAIDLDTLAGFDGTFIDTIRIQDDGFTMHAPLGQSTYGDTTLEIDAIATRTLQLVECTLVFYTDPPTVGNITFEGVTYLYGQSGNFSYGLIANATANAPAGWVFDHWIAEGNITISSPTDNPTRVTVSCGGNLTAVFRQLMCRVVFYTVPSTIGNITFEGDTYTNGQSDTFLYGTSGLAYANAPEGWIFDHWEIVGNVQLSSSTTNPTTFTITCGGNLTAVFRQTQCLVKFFTDPSTVGNITFNNVTYTHGQSNTFPYDTSGLAYANAPTGWAFDHWITMGNVQVSSTTANPTTFTIKCGGNLTAVFKQVQCLVKFYTDPCSVGNITFKGVTYTCGQSDTFPYGTSGLATANAPAGWVFDHWVTVGNVEVSSTTSNPTTFTIRCGGELTAVFIQRGTGDFGTIGYWKHVFYVWKTGKGTFKEYIEAILEDYLERINATSTVFNENYTLTTNSAYDLLWNHDSSMRIRALKQCLASWLNWADGATSMTQMVDTNYDGIPDMTFGDAMEIVENILRDSNSSWEDLEYAKNICDSINNM